MLEPNSLGLNPSLKVKVTQSCLTLCDHGVSPWNSPGQNTGVLSLKSTGDLPDPGTELGSPALQADSLPTEL